MGLLIMTITCEKVKQALNHEKRIDRLESRADIAETHREHDSQVLARIEELVIKNNASVEANRVRWAVAVAAASAISSLGSALVLRFLL